MVGRKATVVGDFVGKKGRVYIDGEYWNVEKINVRAEMKDGDEVYIKKVDGLLLYIENNFKGED